ncbi:hypothetical protein TNCV_1074101 [Trichonephila clavipes]|uniref:Uncharacterized protein n=1 Tax=Trichonephila clavipes TaxID=2585209 RepID=A0A8X6VRB5_TRICX|nr:hypothetical protein TNCV_1074101 [Trichonephila clavipes]
MRKRVGKASPLEVTCVEEFLNIMFSKKKVPPTSYEDRNIENSYAISSWRLLIYELMFRHIKNCTEEEAHRQQGKNEWSTTLDKLNSFISSLYVLGIYGVNNLELDSLLSAV